MAAKKKTEGSVKHARNRHTATGESATREDTIKGLNPEKAIGFSKMSVKDTPRVETVESLPQDHPMMQPRAKKAVAKKKPISPEERFARSEKANKELDSLEGLTSSRSPARYEGAGPESGQLTTTTNYPIPTSKNGGAPQLKTPVKNSGRKAYDFEFSTGNLAYEAPVNASGIRIAGKSTEEQHAAKLRRLQSAKPHQVDSIKREISAFTNKEGHSHGMPDVCTGPRCANTIPFTEDRDYCGGDTCTTATANATPTPRPGK